MKKTRQFPAIPALLAVIGVLALALAACLYLGSRNRAAAHGETPAPYEETLVAYLDALKEGTSQAAAYTAFPNEIIEQDYRQSPMRISGYDVLSSSRVNENLYAFRLTLSVSGRTGEDTPLYYFVGCQDGAYTVYINAAYVPEALHENFNAADYSDPDPDSLGAIPQFEE